MELNPETASRRNEDDDSIPSLNDRERMLLFSFVKYTVGKKTQETRLGSTYNTNHIGSVSSEPLTQYMTTVPREDPVEMETEIGTACFEPSTALLLQDPLNQDTYDPCQALSRPIGSMTYGNTVLAERHGSDGRGPCFFLAKVICVMLFEIPQDKDPVANKIIQANTLSTGLGVTLLTTTTYDNTAEFTKPRGAGDSLPTMQGAWNGL